MLLEIKNLHVSVEETPILQGFNLTVKPGEIHAIMGPNGAGKSTLAKVLAGHPSYEVTDGEVFFKGQDILEMEPEERAELGLFMSFQYPVEIAGVTNEQFLKEISTSDISLDEQMEKMQIKKEFLERDLNSGFSGGEKKKNEILQMLMRAPTLAVLDETDSGLDIDAMRVVSEGVNHFMQEDRALILITHYQRLLDYVKPTIVHVMKDGEIVQSGGPDLALELEEKGYQTV